MEKEQFLEVYRHSLAHILAKAVIEIYGKEVQYAIGPPTMILYFPLRSRREISRRSRARCARS